MRFQSDDEQPEDIDLAPMIDVVFLLLIFFLVATQFKMFEDHLDIDFPETEVQFASNPSPPPRVIVSLNQNGDVRVDNTRGNAKDKAKLKSIIGRLVEIKRENPRSEILIMSHPSATFGEAVRLLDTFSLAGLKDVRLQILDRRKR